MNDLLKLKIEKLPTCPGCYLMKSEGKIIYVGKGGQPQKPRQPVFYPLQGAHGQGARNGCPDR